MSKNDFNKFCKVIVAKFVSSPKINWGKEIKIAQKLLDFKSSKEFWGNLQIDFKLNSLSWFLTNEGKHFLTANETKQFLAGSINKEYVMESCKIGEDLDIKIKPKTISDFLKNKHYGEA